MIQMVKKVRKRTEEEMVKENTKNLVGLKEKLLCLSITQSLTVSHLDWESGEDKLTEREVNECWVRFGKQLGKIARHVQKTCRFECLICDVM